MIQKIKLKEYIFFTNPDNRDLIIYMEDDDNRLKYTCTEATSYFSDWKANKKFAIRVDRQYLFDDYDIPEYIQEYPEDENFEELEERAWESVRENTTIEEIVENFVNPMEWETSDFNEKEVK